MSFNASSLMSKPISLFILIWCAVVVLSCDAQEPKVGLGELGPAAAEDKAFKEKVEALLKSEDVKKQAWAGWYVSERRLVELCPQIEQVLLGHLGATKIDYDLIGNLTDALIQNRYRSDTKLLTALWQLKHRKSLALILAKADPKKYTEFLQSQLGEELEWLHRVSVCNLLLEGNPKRFTESVISRFKLNLSVKVIDPVVPGAGPLVGSGLGAFSWTSGSGRPRRDPKLAPEVHYELSSISRKRTLLAGGPTPIYVKRRINPNGANDFNKNGRPTQHGYWRDCLHFLTKDTPRLAGVKSDQLRFRSYLTNEWSNLDALRKEVLKARDKLHAPWHQLCLALIEKKLLPADTKIETLFPVKVELKDSRKKPERTLPKIEDLLKLN